MLGLAAEVAGCEHADRVEAAGERGAMHVVVELERRVQRERALVDLGDAIRDWCHVPEAIQGERFSVERCRALLEGYLSVADELTELERAWLPRAGRVIALELASRFAWDYLEDSYFAYDATRFPSRRAHNAVRMRDMYLLADEMRAAADELAVWLDERTQ